MNDRHPDTIGTIDMHGTVYEIDWPYRFDDETARENHGFIYLNGEMVGDFCPPLGRQFVTEYDVMAEAFAAVLAKEFGAAIDPTDEKDQS